MTILVEYFVLSFQFPCGLIPGLQKEFTSLAKVTEASLPNISKPQFLLTTLQFTNRNIYVSILFFICKEMTLIKGSSNVFTKQDEMFLRK